jgi:hypothetical protein
MKRRGIANPCTVLAILAIGFLPAAGAAGAELITNGGFEMPVVITPNGIMTLTAPDGASIPGWTIEINSLTGSPSSVDLTIGNAMFNTAYQDHQMLDLDGDNPGQISQTVMLTVGTHYLLMFAYTNNPDNPLGPAGSSSANVLLTGPGGDPIKVDITHTGARQGLGLAGMDWAIFSQAFVANSTSGTLRFTSLDPSTDPFGIYLDAVSIVALSAVPEPSTFAMLGLGFLAGAGVWARRRRAA